MSTTPNFYDETLLLKRFYRAKAMGNDGRLNADHEASFDTVKALLENNTWDFGDLRRSDKILTVSAMYPHACGITAKNYDSDHYCAFDCTEGSSNAKDFDMPTPIFADFCLNEHIGRTNELNDEDFFAENAIMAERAILEQLSQIAIAILEANLGVNVYSGKGVVSGTDTIFSPASWTSNIVADLVRIAKMNKFSQSYILDSGLLWNQMFNAQNNTGFNADKIAFDKLGRYYADLVNIDLVNDPDHVAYMIEKGATGLTSKTFLPDFTKQGPKSMGNDEWRWSQPMALAPGLIMDVHMKIECDPLTDEKVWKYKYILRYGMWVNPTGCNTTNTGILRLLCGNAQ